MNFIDENSAEKLANAILNAYIKSGGGASSVVVFGVIPTGSNLLRFPKPIRHNLSDVKLKNPSDFTAAVQIPFQRRPTVESLVQILSQLKEESLEIDFFLMSDFVDNMTPLHKRVRVTFEGITFNVVFRMHDEDWDGPLDDSSKIKDIVPLGITFSYAFQKTYLQRAVMLAFGS